MLLLLAEELPPADLVALLRACARAPARWCPVLVEAEVGGLRALPLAPAHDYALEEVARFARTGDGGLVLRFEDLGDHVRAARHAINNPLAAALVEVQLLMMDAPDGDARQAYGNIQEQLRRIKDLVAGLGFPPPQRPDRPAA